MPVVLIGVFRNLFASFQFLLVEMLKLSMHTKFSKMTIEIHGRLRALFFSAAPYLRLHSKSNLSLFRQLIIRKSFEVLFSSSFGDTYFFAL